MIVIAGSPRSLAEMDFVAGMYPCEVCGDWRPVAWKTGGTGDDWIAHASCPRCANERAFSFHSTLDLVEEDHPDLELGGPEASQILEPFDLVREIDRIAPAISRSPESLDGDTWEQNHLAVDRIRTALAELAKFLVGDAIPLEAHRSGLAHADRAIRAERYMAAWIRNERAYWAEVAQTIALDAPRIFAAARTKAPRGTFDLEALASHRVWVESRGARGKRLVVVTADAAARVVRGATLAGSRLEKISLAGADLVGTELAGAELIEVDFTAARLETATLTDARLTWCVCIDMIGEHTSFAGSHVEHTDFTKAKLATSQFTRAHIDRSAFRGTDLADTQLGLARFVQCDFRDASLAGAVLAGAVFESCDLRNADLSGADLRGTSFFACAFADATGTPIAHEGWLVVDADFSDRADGTDLGDAEDLYGELSFAPA